MRPRLSGVLAVATVALAAAAAAPVWAQNPAGAEFRVNTYTTNYQYARANAVSSAGNGSFVIVWESPQDASGYAVMARRYDASGTGIGSEFRVNTYTTSHQYFGAVDMNPRGRFVITWQSYGQEGAPDIVSQTGVYAQRYNRDGQAQDPVFAVNTFTTDVQARASVALDAGGAFTVAWRSVLQDGDASGVFGRRFSVIGQPASGEFSVNAYTTQYQNRPDVARAANGSFVIVWQSNDQEADGSGYGIFGQRYNAAGAPVGSEFRINSYTTDDQHWPSVAMDAAGNFVVVWQDDASRPADETANTTSVRAQCYDANGVAVGGEFRVTSGTVGDQYQPSVARAADSGRFVVTWTQSPGGVSDGDGSRIEARRYDDCASTNGTDFQVNSNTLGYQYASAITMDPAANYQIVWNSDTGDGDDTTVQARRFGGMVPAVLAVDTPDETVTGNGNGVFEPGENVDVRPGWRNVTNVNQNISQTNLGPTTGPTGAGVTYATTDATALYPTINNGATGSCTGTCYAVSVTNPATRPVTHWDASALETLGSTDSDKRWTFHIGRSFTDVPSTNIFYASVETLLHHGVTGGCQPGLYCPASTTTRQEMAVFVLAAKEGGGFAPPACTTAPFNDVPANSGFCPYIAELSRRGVVSGCGAGIYCPGSAVTRQEMAIFALGTLDPTFLPPACTVQPFNDVPTGSPFCRYIAELARRGIVGGCGGGNYCPTNPVTRQEMGVFISGTFSLTLYGP
jgi:hypothetical protein